jgi:aspartyl-tRNA(Asn)/glutamyl-tRNA(Gln) amidotransferase subunit A
MGSSLDCVGPLAKNVEDASLVLDVMAGKDDRDMTMIDRDERPYTELDFDLKGKNIALIEEYLNEDTEPEIKKVIQSSLDKFEKAGARVTKIRIPSLSLSLPVYYILCLAELSSNLSRYDGQRYGYNYKDVKDLDESYTMSRYKGFGVEAKRRIMIGAYVLSSGYYDAYYKKAQVVRTKLINEFNQAFEDNDFLIGAVSPSNPFKIGEKAEDPLKMYLSDLYVTGANLVGIPAISVPAGYSGGLSVGLQILAPQKKDRQLLSIAKAFEELTL